MLLLVLGLQVGLRTGILFKKDKSEMGWKHPVLNTHKTYKDKTAGKTCNLS